MANFKRKKRKTFRYPTCPGGLKCHYDVGRRFADNSKLRHNHLDWRKPQMYDDNGRMVS
jgi:hypothetical protein